ncbi:hypothetical protein BJ912DRAFT_929198 [Pholiota molesta]|nr:hypothetical protein BJ912DRAFT_929198 [Pholiota molesta]
MKDIDGGGRDDLDEVATSHSAQKLLLPRLLVSFNLDKTQSNHQLVDHVPLLHKVLGGYKLGMTRAYSPIPTNTSIVVFATETLSTTLNSGNGDTVENFSGLRILSSLTSTTITSRFWTRTTMVTELSPDPSAPVVSSVTRSTTLISTTRLHVFGGNEAESTTTVPTSTSSFSTRTSESGSQSTRSLAPLLNGEISVLISASITGTSGPSSSPIFLSPSITKATGEVLQQTWDTSSFTTAATPPLLSLEGPVSTSCSYSGYYIIGYANVRPQYSIPSNNKVSQYNEGHTCNRSQWRQESFWSVSSWWWAWCCGGAVSVADV